MSMNIYRPFGGALSMRDLMSRLFEESFVHPERLISGIDYQHPMELCERDDEYVFRMALPGLRPEDCDITLAQDTLTIKGELQPPEWEQQMQQQSGTQAQQGQQKMQQQAGTQPQQGQQQMQQSAGAQRQKQSQRGEATSRTECLFSEMMYGTFTRRVTLPTQIDADKASAQFCNGMLTLHLPKSTAAKPKRLQIQSTSK